MKLVSVEEMRQIEKTTDAGGHSYAAMMDMAGKAVAEIAAGMILSGPDQKILVLVGPGNNGGDGLVAAHYLREMGHVVTVYVWKRNIRGDKNFSRLKRRRRDMAILWADNDPDGAKLQAELRATDLIIDALLGTGVTRPIEGDLASILQRIKTEVDQYRAAPPPSFELLGVPRFPLFEAQMIGVKPDPDPTDYVPDPDEFFADDDFLNFAHTDPELAAGFGLDEDDFDDDYDDDFFWDDVPSSPTFPWPKPTILAVDCPSGLDCDTGAVDPLALQAELTVTFAFPKWGHLQHPGAGKTGLLSVVDIGVPPPLAEEIQTEIISLTAVRQMLPPRPPSAHKGTFGKAMIVAGSLNYTGAAHLSAAAATRAGAGLVTLAVPAPLHAALAGSLPDVTWQLLPGAAEGCHTAEGVLPLLAALDGYTALLVGPGLTTLSGARGFVEGLFAPDGLPRDAWQGRAVIDADALNILAALPDWAKRLPARAVLTPHPGEMARLTGATTAEINAQRIRSARDWAAKWGHIVVLKGAHTVIAEPEGRAVVLPFAAPTLATAGSGDVLAGAIVAMLAQGLAPFSAAVCGAYLHAFAGTQIWIADNQFTATASDLVAKLPKTLTTLYKGGM